VVKWTAKTLNLSLETTADIYEVINFLIIALAIVVPLFRVLPKFLRNRKEKLRGDIESARKVTEDANARLSAVEAKLASLDQEIQKFRAEVETESLQDEARIKASLGEESARIVETAEQEIGMAAAQARRGLRHFASDLAVDQAAKQLVLTPETDRALIAEFVGAVAGNGPAGEGKR
jgi:F-type H+-transporting ATPase subunit b